MGPHKPSDTARHPGSEELERYAGWAAERGGEQSLPADLSALRAHVSTCAACLEEVSALEALARSLAALPRHTPAPSFADRVMARVCLPRPWHVRARRALRAHWVSTSAAAATTTASVAGVVWALISHPGLTPGHLAGLGSSELRALGLKVVISLGQALFNTGLPSSIGEFVRGIGASQALLAMAALSLLAGGATYALSRLMRSPAILAPTTKTR